MIFLANDLLRRGRPLEAGDIVLTGKVAPAVRLQGEAAHGTFSGMAEPLGALSVQVN